MDERRSGDAAFTGVARGALGTGTALDETQEWVIPEGLQGRAAAPAEQPISRPPVAPVAPEPTRALAAAAVRPEPAPAAGAEPAAAAAPEAAPASAAEPAAAAAPVPVPVEPVDREFVTRRRSGTTGSGGRFSPGPRAAGLAAVILLALVGVTAVVTSLDRDAAEAGTPAQPTVTTAPTDGSAADADDDGDSDGDGKKDKDNGKDHGGGNGNGHGGGNGNGHGGGRGDD
jgi:hypothetical protein